MSILVLQHSDHGGPGRLGLTFRDHGLRTDIRRPDRGAPIPSDLDDLQGLLILGSPDNVTDIAAKPWMQAEAELIRKAHAAQLPTVGICFGAQLIAHALGGTVAAKSTSPDVGFFPLSINTTGQVETILAGIPWNHHSPFSCGQEITQLPVGSALLASTPTTRNACFRVGIRTFGFIFHFECDRPMTDQLFTASSELSQKASKSASDLAGETDRHYPNFARIADRLCVNLATTLFPLARRGLWRA
jgi:GMP synthase-like glutamine amidotransferase